MLSRGCVGWRFFVGSGLAPLMGLASLAGLIGVALLTGCQQSEGCLGGAPECQVPAPCPTLAFPESCDDPLLEVRVLAPGDPLPGGLAAIGGFGDIVLGNSKAVAVIAALGNQNYLDPNGGSLLDLSARGKDDDSLNQVLQVVGILPRDTAHYSGRIKLIDQRPNLVAVQVQGTLDSVPGATIYTRYEMRPCDPGVRIRTELVNGTPDQQVYALSDGFYWSLRETLPFTPTTGTGFDHQSFDLLTINEAYKSTPLMAASGHSTPAASYAVVGCNQDSLEGFQSEGVSTVGLPRTVLPPREYAIYERFLAVAPRGDVAGAADIAQGMRARLYGDQTLVLRGRVKNPAPGKPLTERESSVLISAGRLSNSIGERTPLSQVVPAADGSFSAVVPVHSSYVVALHSFGRRVAEVESVDVSGDRDVGTLELPAVARVTATVQDTKSAMPLDAEVFVIPADEATRLATIGTLHGQFGSCAPWLGPPPGQSPACNRFLVAAKGSDGPVQIPMGRYHLYAFHGPFYTLGRQTVDLQPGDVAVQFKLTPLDLKPMGSLSADLHVHGAGSFDSSIPDRDRVLSFAATNVDVIIATDHDVAHDYSGIVRELGLDTTLATVVGVETTGHIPFLYAPGLTFPLVIGHYNFWPIRYQPGMPRFGAPFDELMEPGELFDHTDPLFVQSAVTITQFNHPWADPIFGRDLGFARAIGMSALRDLPEQDDGTANGMYVRRPKGGHRNNDHVTQEVMNGGRNEQLLAYRQFWFWGLNQGQLKTGTANSDSHGLTDDTVGSPRNVVYTDTRIGPAFDINRVNQALRDGRSFGTNGPIIQAQVDQLGGGEADFGMQLIRPAPAGKLHLEVAAAPWVPVDEVRIVVNGVVRKRISGAALTHPTDPFGAAGILRYQGDAALSELLPASPASGDAWIVIEAGWPLPLASDLGGGPDGGPDGIPDTSDNNHDGRVDQLDVGVGQTYGPLSNPPPPKDETDTRYHFAQVVVDSYPASFTNPFLLDLDGDGKFTPPRTAVPQPDGSSAATLRAAVKGASR